MNWYSKQQDRYRLIRRFRSPIVTGLKVFSYIISLAGLLVLSVSFFQILSAPVIGLSLTALALGLLFLSLDFYISYLSLHPDFQIGPADRSRSVLNYFDLDCQAIFAQLKKRASFEDLCRATFSQDKLMIILYRCGLIDVERIIGQSLNSQVSAEQFVTKLADEAAANKQTLITIYQFLSELIRQDSLAKQLLAFNLNVAEVSRLISFYDQIERSSQERQQYYLEENLVRTGGIAKDWAISYTNLLDRFTQQIDPALAIQLTASPVFGREKELSALMNELNKTTNQNILLVGPNGVGKKELFYHLSEKILTSKTKTKLDRFQIRFLDLNHLLASVENSQQLQNLFQALFSDMRRAGNVILFIDQIDILLSEGPELSRNAANLLADYLNDQRIKIIATVTNEKYIQLIKSNPLLNDRFSRVELEPLPDEELEKILLYRLGSIESRHRVFFSLMAIKAAISLAKRYLKDQVSPSRELSLLEEVAVYSQAKSQFLITDREVSSVVGIRAKVPIEVGQDEAKVLLNLEAQLHSRIIGQDRPIKLISDALLRGRSGLSSDQKPLGSFLFLGPTGVGKTETAKALADIYFGGRKNLIRLDMTEYSDERSLEKLLGTDPARQPGSLTVAIQDHPSSVLLLDEIEKASSAVKNVFLQLLDEGRLTTNFGRVLDFTNSIIIATSNAGSERVKEKVSSGTSLANFEKELLDQLIKEGVFLSEFLNRFDATVVYLPLTVEQINQVVKLRLQLLSQRLKEQKGLALEVSSAVAQQLAREGYDPVFGARALDRVIKEKLETLIARQIIDRQLTAGGRLVVEAL